MLRYFAESLTKIATANPMTPPAPPPVSYGTPPAKSGAGVSVGGLPQQVKIPKVLKGGVTGISPVKTPSPASKGTTANPALGIKSVPSAKAGSTLMR